MNQKLELQKTINLYMAIWMDVIDHAIETYLSFPPMSISLIT